VFQGSIVQLYSHWLQNSQSIWGPLLIKHCVVSSSLFALHDLTVSVVEVVETWQVTSNGPVCNCVCMSVTDLSVGGGCGLCVEVVLCSCDA